MLKRFFLIFALVLLMPLSNTDARKYIRIVGSSTVFPFISFIAEEFSRVFPFKTPVVESIGSGSGFKMFCLGIGEDTPDITTSSRPIKEVERELCKRNKVNEVIEIIIGYDGVVIANSNQSHRFDFTKNDLFETLSAYSQENGRLVKNNKKFWSDVNQALPKTEIKIYGPHQNTGTHETLVNFIMLDQYSCMNSRIFKENYKDQEKRKKACSNIRDDGRYIEVGINENIIIQKLKSNKNALGIFSFSFLAKNQDEIQGSTIAGIEPTYKNISSGEYMLARPLYLYIKKEHLYTVDGLREFIKEVVDSISTEGGYLSRLGLILLSSENMKKVLEKVRDIM
ncbi:phosphate ABC transporter, periplasmic phosphate-binding protein [Wolbachia endosymbiont of Armadillidium vulgare str. wVulC]|uniref:Substrate-binding domain-containing protein n=1 Tax=Wolbachia endosymbiont of Armadillidium arcangelii TaxID=3158571 RepID=A0AAU7Q5Q8_9RICK|nr:MULTISPECIES: substrate-binding domain-containing protein [unclassified Wolbachia]KLT23413.1 phosphate ABC transporter, periplasmic phosphate-binding protein [Wolbachia endosymbiont of Armadillidium vulgare str. wVulC]RDD35153.1 Phosphate-binding protein pstS precursor [Wolbachia endosymbiont of Cylisticus convexus]